MKPTSLLWFTVPLMGFLLASHAYAASLDDEAKKVVMEYFLSRKMITLCGESFSLSTQEQKGLHMCEVCMSFQRGAMCRTAFSTDVNMATLTARDTACTFLAHSDADEIVCSQTPPARVTCSQQKAEELENSKGFDITIHQEKLSYADKRKKIQWKGTGSVEAKELRIYAHNTWSPLQSMPTKLHVTIIKEKGNWAVQPNDEIKTLLAHKELMDCKRMESVTK
jgi:hypothetical protein